MCFGLSPFWLGVVAAYAAVLVALGSAVVMLGISELMVPPPRIPP